MYPRQLLRKLRPSFPSRSSALKHAPRRFQSSRPPPDASTTRTQARANKVLDRVPRFLRRYTDGLRNAPVSHVVAFLILHEITAVVPLVGLASYFHYTNWLPVLFSDSTYISSGVEKFGNYFRRKQWFGLSEDTSITTTKRAKAWNASEAGTKIVVEVATAYAVTKAILPLRLMLSVWLTPWFARVAIGKVGKGLAGLGRSFKRSSTTKAEIIPAARTGATGTGSNAMKKDTMKP